MNIVLNWMFENENKSEKGAQIHARGIVREINASFAPLYYIERRWNEFEWQKYTFPCS